MPLIVERQQQYSNILESSQQRLQQRQYTEENCTCANILANKTSSSCIINTTATIANNTSNSSNTSSNSTIITTTSSRSSHNNITTMNQMPFKRAVHNISKDVVKVEAAPHKTTNNKNSQRNPNTRGSSDNGINNNNNTNNITSLATNRKIAQFSYCAAKNVVATTQTMSQPPSGPPPLEHSSSPSTPAALSFFGGILVSSNNSSFTTTSSASASSSSSAPSSLYATSLQTSALPLSPLSSGYLQMKKYCRRFLILISLICLLHSCLLWDSAAAAISNRATNSRTLSNSPQSVAGNQPRFLSRGHTYRAVVGDTLVLPCQVENLGNFVLLWRRGINVLTASNIMVTRDERVRLIDGYNLEISDLEPQDAGDYVCQISDKINRDQVHTVEILVPPSVRATPTSGNLQARKGGPVTLECKGSGNPVPSIYWTKKSGVGKSTARIGDGPILTLDKVERQQAGIYQCTADNGVGEPVSVDIRLDVLYPPDIQVEKSWIHSGEGFEAKLVCIVYADPIASVSWYQNSFLIQSTDRRIMSSRGNRHTLTIRHIQQEDFGNYSCIADNSLGRSRKYMELSGRPGPAEFYSPKWGRSSDSYNLTWKIDSYPPLEEVRLLYRRVLMNDTFQQPGRWHDFILTPEHRPVSEPLTHIMSYTIKNLVPGAYYEAIVQAKNRYGWNEVSDIFQFIVASNSMDIPPEESEVVASSKSRSNTGTSSLLNTTTPYPIQILMAILMMAVSCLCHGRHQFSLG
ncbi:klingon [Haematobia irritans]|uniref:klingon n=1 Tax=Haematobia irritans TaxID=7368 RepID=UPI003F50833B